MTSASTPEHGQLAQALADGIVQIREATTSDQLRTIVSALTGKKGPIASIKSSLGKVADIEARKELGQLVNDALAALGVATDGRSRELRAVEFSSQIESERVDMTEIAMSANVERRLGRMHLVTQAMERLEDVFIGLGFQIAEGPEVETDFYNFEALNMPPSHPARSMWDTLFVESDVEGSVVLRTHTSPVQIRVMQDWPPPIYAVMPGRVCLSFIRSRASSLTEASPLLTLPALLNRLQRPSLVLASHLVCVRRIFHSLNQVPNLIFVATTEHGLNWAAAEWCTLMSCELVA